MQISKLTTNKSDRKEQRDRTKDLIDKQKTMKKLSKTPPTYLKKEARKAWLTIVPQLLSAGYVTALDKSTIEAYCINYQALVDAYESLKEDGILIESRNGIRKNPATGVINDATAKLNSISDRLGLSPSARATIGDGSDDDNDSIESLHAALTNNGGDDF